MTAQPATKPTRAGKSRAKPNLRVVGGPDLDQLESVLTEFAEQQAPMVSRASVAKQQMEADVAELEGELSGIEAKQALMNRAHEALTIAFEADKADVRRAIGLRTGGLTQDKLVAADERSAAE